MAGLAIGWYLPFLGLGKRTPLLFLWLPLCPPGSHIIFSRSLSGCTMTQAVRSDQATVFLLPGPKGGWEHVLEGEWCIEGAWMRPSHQCVKAPCGVKWHAAGHKGPSSQGCGFPSSHIWMWKLDYKGSWALKNWCSWTVLLEKTLESPLDCNNIQLVNPKGNQSWTFIGRTDAEAETPIFGHLMWRTDSLEKTLMLGKIEGRRTRGQ